MRDSQDRLLTPGEVAHLFHVDPRTVTRWANEGRLPSIRTLGGHRRFPASSVFSALDKYPRVPGTDTEKPGE